MDVLSGSIKKLDHNRFTWLGFVLAVTCIGWIVGCQPKTESISTGELVSSSAFQLDASKLSSNLETRIIKLKSDIEQVNQEIEFHNDSIDRGIEDLQRQDEMRAQLVELVGGAVPGLISGSLNPASLVSTGVSLLALFGGVGAVVDNKRKNDVISSLKKVTTG